MVLSVSLSSIFDLTNHVPWIWADLKDNTDCSTPINPPSHYLSCLSASETLSPWDISIQCMVAAKTHLLILSQPWINHLVFPNDTSNLWSQSLPSPWQHQDNKWCCVLPLWIVVYALVLFFRFARSPWGMLIRDSCGTALQINTKTNLFQTILKHIQKNFIQREHIIAFDLHITHNANIF